MSWTLGRTEKSIIEPEQILNNLKSAKIVKEGTNEFYILILRNHHYRILNKKECARVKNLGFRSMKKILYELPILYHITEPLYYTSLNRIDEAFKGKWYNTTPSGSIIIAYKNYEVLNRLTKYLYEKATIIEAD